MPVEREVGYARTADQLSIAYAVLGNGPVDLLTLWQQPTAFDMFFEHPGHLRYFRFLEGVARIITFDRRGIGASDPAPPTAHGDREAWIADAVAVLDSAATGPVVVQGEGFGGLAGIALAVTHPERVRALVLLNSYARLLRDDDHPIGASERSVAVALERNRASWGTGEVVANAVPGLAGEPTFDDFLGRFERLAASPATAAACIEAGLTADVRDLLDQVTVPTLVLHTGDQAFISRDHSRHLAEHIPGATFVEAPTESFYGMDPGARQIVQEFITGIAAEAVEERELLTVVFSDIVASTERLFRVGDAEWNVMLDAHDAFVRDEVARGRGRVVKHTGDGHLVTFAHPTDAIRVMARIRDAAHMHGLAVRTGVHFGEVTPRPDGDVTGSAVNIAARVMAAADGGQILVSRTVTDLVAGANIVFSSQGDHDLKGVPGTWTLFAVDA